MEDSDPSTAYRLDFAFGWSSLFFPGNATHAATFSTVGGRPTSAFAMHVWLMALAFGWLGSWGAVSFYVVRKHSVARASRPERHTPAQPRRAHLHSAAVGGCLPRQSPPVTIRCCTPASPHRGSHPHRGRSKTS